MHLLIQEWGYREERVDEASTAGFVSSLHSARPTLLPKLDFGVPALRGGISDV
jgi:hypothetical protein